MFDLDVKQPMRRFSRGMLKQAAFWLAISMRPELLILDEPVDGLDPVMRRQVWALIMQDVAEYGTTVLTTCASWRTSATGSASSTGAGCSSSACSRNCRRT